jgi:hypothetical protein
VTSDIASEGVNLHHQCHHLIHFDLPWSLITLEQRNGRIDRYGQLHPPEVRYLVYEPANSEIASDVRVVAKLIEKENAAHKALGDVGSIMGLYSESAEEDAIIAALRERTEEEREQAFEKATPTTRMFDPWAFAGLESALNNVLATPQVDTEPVPSMFRTTDDYVIAGLRLIYGDLTQIGWETDGSVISFEPPSDLFRRLGALPQSYLRQRNIGGRLRLTTNAATANRYLEQAVNAKGDSDATGTAWPEVHFLGPQHPVLDWLADKLLYRVERNAAIAIPCDVDAPTVLMSGVWSNKLGEPIAAAWLAATVEGGLATFADLFETLARAGVTDAMVNPSWEGDLGVVEEYLATVVNAVATNLADTMEGPLALVHERLSETRKRLERWQTEARLFAEAMKSETSRRRRLTDIERVTHQIEALITNHTPASSPLIRVIGALVPRN